MLTLVLLRDDSSGSSKEYLLGLDLDGLLTQSSFRSHSFIGLPVGEVRSYASAFYFPEGSCWRCY